jgi:hypothetical protein
LGSPCAAPGVLHARDRRGLALYETRRVWAEHTEAARRALALSIEDDEHGYAWLTFGCRRIEPLGVHEPGDVRQSGVFRDRMRRGLPPEVSYDAMPRAFFEPPRGSRCWTRRGSTRRSCFRTAGSCGSGRSGTISTPRA